jgi:hypothetical protein
LRRWFGSGPPRRAPTAAKYARLQQAADIQKRAAKAGQYSAAIAALIAKAKLAGRWVERAEQKNTNVNYIVSDQPMTEEEWVAEHVTEH